MNNFKVSYNAWISKVIFLVYSECVKSISTKHVSAHKHTNLSSSENDNSRSVSYFNSTNKIIDKNVSDRSNICNNYYIFIFKF